MEYIGILFSVYNENKDKVLEFNVYCSGDNEEEVYEDLRQYAIEKGCKDYKIFRISDKLNYDFKKYLKKFRLSDKAISIANMSLQKVITEINKGIDTGTIITSTEEIN